MSATEHSAEAPSGDRGWLRRARHGLRAAVKRPLLWLALRIAPPIYLAYMRFVWWTSRVDDRMQGLWEPRRAHDGIVGILWHEEVFSVAWAYRDFGPHTLASLGDAGEAITRLLERCNFTVFRGGSAKARARRRVGVLADMIEHMKTTHDVIYGLTVDGSMGPRYVLKKGAIAIAAACDKPLAIVRTWARRNVRLPTWDRMAIPLPFNRITRTWRGPYFVPEGAGDDPAKLEVFRQYLELELARHAKESYLEHGQRVPAALEAVLEGAGGERAP